MKKQLKNLILFFTCLVSGCEATMAQRANDQLPTGTPGTGQIYVYSILDTTALTGRSIWYYFGSGKSSKGVLWNDMKQYVAMYAPSPTITGGTILRVPQPGDVIPTGSPNAVWNAMYRPPLPPTATLTGGTIFQYSGSSHTHTLSFSYGRQPTTATINNPVIFNPGGINEYTSQPAQPGTVTGSQSVTTPANTNVTYSLSVTDANGFNTTATTTDTSFPFYYVGTCAGTTPTSAEVLAATTKNFGFGTAYDMNFTFSGSNLHVFYAYYNSYATVTSVKDAAGNQAIAAMTLNSLSLTDNGFTGTWKTVTTNNTYSNATIVLQIRP